MTFESMLGELKKIRFEETRSQDENYFEAVLNKEGMESISAVLQTYFGMPLKPEGESPSAQASQYSEPYGGIRSNQTMYYQETAEGSDTALLWPWGNGCSITLKIYRNS